jgi:hypothetical protein
MALAKAMQDLKGNSSRWLGQHSPDFAWQEGYWAFSISPPNKRAVMAYISGQEQHHAKRSFETELISMLHKAEIKYDEHYLFG